MSKIKYKAALYLRISKEDGDKIESDSISNQRDLGMDFLSKHPDISLVCELSDDGYTGSNFDRPQFQKMIDFITKGKVNCVIVKDLSRFARDYIGAGYYLEKLFPSLGVRFISINDNIDYKVDNSSNTQLIMAIKNIMNDSYIHDISVKIRSQFEIKRKKGEYIGAFVAYGYKKSSEDKHKLVVDKYAAEIVKDIFNKRMQGISAAAIAQKLNLLNVPSPAEYKKQCGSNFHPNLQKNYVAKWSAKAVIRILTNELYTGTLIQGKHTTVNHKVKKLIEKEQNQWVVIRESHEAIVTQEQFDIVQKVIKQDTRVKPGNKQPYLFSGFLKCADCGDSMIRRTAKYNDKTYAYYMCSRNKLGCGCSSHRVKEDVLYTSVLTAINSYCKNVSDLSKRLNEISFTEIEAAKVAEIEKSQQDKSEEIVDLRHTMEIVESRCRNSLESRESCNEICADIRLSIKKLEIEIRLLDDEKANITQEVRKNRVWIDFFTENGDLKELNRTILANLVDEILVHEDKRIVIKFNYQDKYMQLLKIEEKRDRKESESIKYQKQMIFDYIKERDDMEIYSVYCDNGETGTNFERDDFQRMMYDVYNGKVNCIIVKDLSRFGREYIEMGDYLEKIFPLIGVRFIAINDHYDNKVEMFHISVPIKNIINTLYAKDLSKKSAAALRMKQINGEYIGDHPVYGYVKSKEDKHKLVIDEEAAEVVRMIFNWKAEGCSNVFICRKLFALNIMPPARYKYEKGILKNKKYAELEYWTDATVALMLKNETYIGNMPQGKTKSHFFDGKRIEKIKPEEWIVVEGTHEPIISKDLFDKVQGVVAEYRKTHKKVFEAQKHRKPVDNVLQGKVFCGNCGHKCRRHKGIHNGKPEYNFVCSIHMKFPQECNYISAKEEVLKEIVLKSVKVQIAGLADLKMSFDKIMKKQNTKLKMADLTGRISNALTAIANIKAKRIRLSTDLAKQYIGDDEYGALREQYDDELNAEIKKLNGIYKEQENLNKLLSIEKWVAELKKYGKAKKLTAEIVDAFVESIKLYLDKRIEISWKHTEVFAEAVNLLEGGEQFAG